MTKFGWKAGSEQFAPTKLLTYAMEAEQAGFDLLAVSDHFQPWSEEGQAAFTWTWLGAAAVKTSRIGLGPGVTCPILRYHPAIIAQAAATVSQFAPDRTYLGLGTGKALNEYAAIGAWPEYEERKKRLCEAIELIRALWSGEDVTYEGQYYQTRKARLYTPPANAIPLYISALVPESARLAGEYGDGLFTVGGKKTELYQNMLQQFEQGARAAGKNPARMPRLIELSVEYEQDIDGAIQNHLKYWAGTHVPALFNRKIYTPKMSEENGKIVTPEAVKQSGCMSAFAEDHLKFARQYIDLGFTHLIFHSARQDQRAFIEAYSRDVIAQLRKPVSAKAA